MTAAGSGKTRGFALIVVVWFLVLIGAMGTWLIVNGRAETAIARNIRAAADAEGLADAGIARVVFNQTDAKLQNRWKLDGTPYRIAMTAGEISVRLQDESQKINPNLASQALLEALFEVRGVDRNTARRLGAAVADWVSPPGPARPMGAKLDEYRAAGRSYGPPNAPMETLDELGLVLGMTPAIQSLALPYLSIHTQTAEPNVQDAPTVIRRAVELAAKAPDSEKTAPNNAAPPDANAPAGANGQPGVMAPPANFMGAPQQAGVASNPDAAPAQANPAAQPAAATGPQRLIAAQITARSRDGGVFVRYAVLRLDTGDSKGYAILDWRRGSLDEPSGGAPID